MFNIQHPHELPAWVKIAAVIWLPIVMIFAVANCDATRPIIEHNAELIEEGTALSKNSNRANSRRLNPLDRTRR